MRLLLVAMMICSGAVMAAERKPANDEAMRMLINQYTKQEPEERKDYCRGNPPGSDDAWCSWVCIDGSWKRMCR